jgi:myosin heavy subunit
MSVWKTVAAVMLLGQIDFDKLSFENIHSNKEGVIKNMDIVTFICGLFGIKKAENFKKMLLNTRTKVKADISWTALSQKQCIDNRDAFAK